MILLISTNDKKNLFSVNYIIFIRPIIFYLIARVDKKKESKHGL